MRASLALNLQVQETSRFARKNYFYPDLPKGYQISMYELPLATAGWLEIDHDGARKRIGITRLHLEEDAAKNLHEGFPDSDRSSYIDYNRGGTPLAEIVSEPDLRSPAEAYAYLNALKQVLEYAEVSDCNMEEGSLRCDANVSVRRRGAERFGTKAEVKNLNSFRYLQRALEYEIERQIGVLESGGRIAQETRLWNVGEGRTDPDALEGIRARLSLFPRSRPAAGSRAGILARGRNPARDAGVARRAPRALRQELRPFRLRRRRAHGHARARAIISRRSSGRCVRQGRGQLDFRPSFSAGSTIPAARRSSPVSPAALADLLRRVEAGSITGAQRKKGFRGDVRDRQIGGRDHRRRRACRKFRTPVKSSASAAKSSRKIPTMSPNIAPATKAYSSFLSGQVMRASRGQANPQIVNETLKRLLG